MKHKHAENMVLYAQDAMETDKPWERWQFKNQHTEDEWTALVNHAEWGLNTDYRRKPRTININDFDVPEPVREPLKVGQEYIYVNIHSPSQPYFNTWNNDGADEKLLKSGIIHLTREAAETHAKALLSFTQKRP
jgi:hypothetical protein